MEDDVFQSMTNCNECPCLNKDYEAGEDCNLGYITGYYWDRGGNLLVASCNCGLHKIQHSDGTLYPIKVEARKNRTDGNYKN